MLHAVKHGALFSETALVVLLKCVLGESYEPVIGSEGVFLRGGASFCSLGRGLFTLGKAFRMP